jgi:hypothetical protein
MDSKSNIPLSFDPDAWELSVVAHRPRNWPRSRADMGSVVRYLSSGTACCDRYCIKRRSSPRRWRKHIPFALRSGTVSRPANGGQWLMDAKLLVHDGHTRQA